MILVALEQLPSIEGADEIRIDVTFSRGKAPLPGELSAKLTERLLQICREKPKPQIQFAVWKGRNGLRGKEAPRTAGTRSIVVVSDAPPAALSFLSQEKR